MPFSPVAVALALCALALPVSIAGTNIALALLTAALALRARGDRKRLLAAWRAEPALAALAVYAAVGLLSSACSTSPAAALKDSVKDFHRLWALGLFVAALAVEPDAPLRSAFGASFAAISLYAAAQTAFGGRPDGMLVRAHGFVHPVVFGEQAAVAALGGACVLLRPTERAQRGPAAVFTALVLAALVLNQTRMALFACAAGFVAVALLEPRARRFALPATGIVALVAAAWEFMPNGGRSISSLFAAPDAHNPHQARWHLWRTAIAMFQDHPFLGVSPGGYHRYFAGYYTRNLDGESGWGSAHNLYLHHLAERGALGGLALLALCWVLGSRATRAARTDADTRALWAAGAMAVFFAMSMTETTFQSEQFATLLLLVWAWGTVSLRPGAESL